MGSAQVSSIGDLPVDGGYRRAGAPCLARHVRTRQPRWPRRPRGGTGPTRCSRVGISVGQADAAEQRREDGALEGAEELVLGSTQDRSVEGSISDDEAPDAAGARLHGLDGGADKREVVFLGRSGGPFRCLGLHHHTDLEQLPHGVGTDRPGLGPGEDIVIEQDPAGAWTHPVPMPLRTSSRPLPTRILTASRTTVRLTW